MSDKEIILKVKNGEINYFEIIVKKYTSKIYNFFKAKISNKEDIDDLVQNTFISFYKSINRFDENLPILPYLYQIARNELKMFYRSKKDLLSLDEKFYFLPDRVKDRIDDFNIDYNDENYFKDLKKEEKEMIMMKAEGFSYKEIAQKFKKKLNTVKSIIRRIRKKLIINNEN